MKMILACVAAVVSLAVGAGAKDAYESMGGLHVRPGSQKGKIAVIDTQSRVPEQAFRDVIGIFVGETKLNVVYEKAEPSDAPALKAASKADIAVVIVADAKTPSLLVAPEDMWAVMNVSKMDKGLASATDGGACFNARCGKELVRVLLHVCGGSSSQYPGNIMNCTRQEDLDKLEYKGLPMDRRQSCLRYLKELGITPAQTVPYEDACQEGWAPKPKDKYQQAIWDEVHAVPANPIKIKFDPKRDR